MPHLRWLEMFFLAFFLFCSFGLAQEPTGPIDESSPYYYLIKYARNYPNHYGVTHRFAWKDPRNGPFTLSGRNERYFLYSVEDWVQARMLSGKGPFPSLTPIPSPGTWRDFYNRHIEAYLAEEGEDALGRLMNQTNLRVEREPIRETSGDSRGQEVPAESKPVIAGTINVSNQTAGDIKFSIVYSAMRDDHSVLAIILKPGEHGRYEIPDQAIIALPSENKRFRLRVGKTYQFIEQENKTDFIVENESIIRATPDPKFCPHCKVAHP